MTLGRRLVAEGLGTAFLLAAVVGSGIMGERSATDTFASIRPADAIPFIAAQFFGAFAATAVFRWLLPSLPAREVLIPHNDLREP